MSFTIDMNYLTRLTGNLSVDSTVRQSAPQSSDFLSMATQLRASESSPASSASEKADRSMEAYRQMVWKKISQMPLSATRQMESISVQISDAAFERMKNDPAYESWVLNDLRVAFSQTNPWVSACGGGYSVFYIGGTKEECRGEGWYPGYLGGQGASIFAEKSKGSFWEQRVESRKEFMEPPEKDAESFWEQRVKRHEKFMELQQEAAMRRWLQQYHLSGGAISAAELLLELL